MRQAYSSARTQHPWPGPPPAEARSQQPAQGVPLTEGARINQMRLTQVEGEKSSWEDGGGGGGRGAGKAKGRERWIWAPLQVDTTL